jgi:hypothetical protein
LNEVNASIAAEQSPDVLERRNTEMRLGLVIPREPQVVRVNESAERRLAARRNSEVFSEEASTGVVPVRFVMGGRR